MDSKTFDALTRGFGTQRTRRDAVKGFAAGLMGLGVVRGAAAQVTIQNATCGQRCDVNGDCNSGLECSDGVLCVRIDDSNQNCNVNGDCGENFEVCRNGSCTNQVVCSACNNNADCPSGESCNNQLCGRVDECNSNSDCRRRQRCRRGRCVRR